MMHRAVRIASRGTLARAQNLSMRTASTASSCSDLRTPLPGAYREPTELWHSDKVSEASSDIEPVKGEADLAHLLSSADSDSLVVIKYHAILCGASRAIEETFRQTAAEFTDVEGLAVTFADVCFDSNRQLCEKMGIRSVPHVQIFSGSCGKIADFSIAPHQYGTLTSLLADRRESLHAGKQVPR